MSSKVTLKLIAVGIFACIAWAATKNISAQQSNAIRASKPLQIRMEPATPNIIRALPGTPDTLVSHNSLEHFSVKATGPLVSVEAAVSMSSKIQTPQHLWRLQVKDATTGQLIVNAPYLNQMFSIDPSGSMVAKYADTIELPPGKYQARVTLYKVPRGIDPVKLAEDTVTHKSSMLIDVWNNVTVQ